MNWTIHFVLDPNAVSTFDQVFLRVRLHVISASVFVIIFVVPHSCPRPYKRSKKTVIGPWTAIADGHTAVRGSSFDSL